MSRPYFCVACARTRRAVNRPQCCGDGLLGIVARPGATILGTTYLSPTELRVSDNFAVHLVHAHLATWTELPYRAVAVGRRS